ncbi:phosphatidate cytidylyltransferase [Rhodopirellula rubra]|uniref:Phosphatidate cytidylyltransferase n=1 Tax=Aporhodopirellula rubra TaxID=980271 RepID=A0A7W5DZC6_9BACT|nr:CDP-archaeol synthase [Aporhodopirellula rubra]MBB3207315.1 phosphatidate cytidylyltransferase [Aporhodopirellula rubra]
MLLDRLRTSGVLIFVSIASLYADANFSVSGAPGLFLFPLLLFFALGTAADLCGLLLRAGFPVHRGVILAATALIALSPYVPVVWNTVSALVPNALSPYPVDCPIGQMGWITLAGIVATLIFFLDEMKDYSVGSDPSGVLRRLTASMFTATYVGLPMSLLVVLRGLGADDVSATGAGNWGLAALLSMIAITKSTDAGAYFTGKSIGRRKLIPRLSPGKTWEGSIGGVVVATLVAAACIAFLFPAISGADSAPPLGLALLLGPLLAICGMVGDLAESLVKRACGAKDSGNLLPGLGGVWDVTDSLIFASLPAFLCFAAVA